MLIYVLLDFSSSLSLLSLHLSCARSSAVFVNRAFFPSRQRELLDRLFPEQLSGCLVQAERQRSLPNLARAGALERVLNRSETEPGLQSQKKLPSSLLTDGQCALELDPDGEQSVVKSSKPAANTAVCF